MRNYKNTIRNLIKKERERIWYQTYTSRSYLDEVLETSLLLNKTLRNISHLLTSFLLCCSPLQKQFISINSSHMLNERLYNTNMWHKLCEIEQCEWMWPWPWTFTGLCDWLSTGDLWVQLGFTRPPPNFLGFCNDVFPSLFLVKLLWFVWNFNFWLI